jgi:hypothetical protein
MNVTSELNNVSNNRFVLAFYGISSSTSSAESFVNASVDLCQSLGLPPDKMAIGGKGFSGRITNFSRASGKLKKSGFSNVEAVNMYTLLADGQIPVCEYAASVAYLHPSNDGGIAVIAVPESSASRQIWLPFAREVAAWLLPSYGIGYMRALNQGPVLFAMGVNYSPSVDAAVQKATNKEAYNEGIAISHWCHTGMSERVYLKGLIRDVYPWNFLTRPQLDRPVGQISLAQWIIDQANRGVLSRLTDTVFLWEVADDRIAETRGALRDAGAIFDWRTHEDE